MTPTRLEPQRYFESIDGDTERLLALAERGLDPPVPCCPGWTVADVVTHVGQVYEHKVRVMADDAWPDPWPPADFEDQEPVAFLTDAKAHLFAEFAEHQITDPMTTFAPDDRTIGFWVRRMALEIAIHRYDAELAYDEPTPIPDDLAVDGVDEILRIMLAGPWWDGRVATDHPVDARVAVETGGRRWLCTLEAKRVSITDDVSTPAAATLAGEPDVLFRWLWGRAGDEQVEISGDSTVAAEFRARLVECTG